MQNWNNSEETLTKEQLEDYFNQAGINLQDIGWDLSD